MPRKFDEVRAEIWRFAARPEMSERELIQRLLDTVGPALGVDRACFNEPDADGMVCTLEWVAEGVKPSVGMRLPSVVQTQLVRPYPLEITLESSIGALPVWARPVGAPALRALAYALDLESVLIVPYSVAGGVVDGVLSFDVSRGKPAPKGWSEPLLPMIYEMALIVGQAIGRKRAEAARSVTENRYRAVVESLGEGVGIIGPDNVFTFVNRAGEQIFGVPDRTLAGRCLSEFVDAATWNLVLEQTELRKAGRKSTYEHDIRRPDGQSRTIEVVCTPEFDASGGFVATLAIFRDVTEQRQASLERRRNELQVLRTQKLESLGVLAGGIAHDFNNVLMGILGHAQLVLQQLPPDHEARDSVEQIRRAALNTSGLTRQMLTYSGKGTVVVECVDLSRIVLEMTELMRAAVSKKADVRLGLAQGLPPIEGDPGQVRQVIMNLLTNASDALGQQPGFIEVCTRTAVLDADRISRAQVGTNVKPGSFVCLEVSDSGCGMSPESQAQMFDPFFSTKFAGRGVGLAAVLGIVRAHHGVIFVDSALDKGTRVSVCLPASSKAPEPVVARPIAPPRAPAGSERRTVLLVDDEPFILSSMRRLLEREGFEVLTASDGMEALEVFRVKSSNVSIVLLDMTMPGMGGSETLAEMRKVRSDICVILCSGFSETELGIRASQQHQTGFLQKPFEQETLLYTIRRMIGDAGVPA